MVRPNIEETLTKFVTEKVQSDVSKSEVIIAQKQTDVTKQEDLETKLKLKLKELRNQQEQETGSGIITDSETEMFSELIKNSSLNPKQFRHIIKSVSGREIDITAIFSDNRCEIVSDLFPKPFYVVNSSEDAVGLTGNVWTLREIFGIVKLLDKFDGRIVEWNPE